MIQLLQHKTSAQSVPQIADCCKIALPSKGHLAQGAADWAKSIGLNASRNGRQVDADVGKKLFFVRSADVPLLLEKGAVDYGVTGLDFIVESGFELKYALLAFGECRLCLAAPTELKARQLHDFDGKRIATSYPHITREYLKRNGITADIVELSGSVEAACKMNLADAIVDVVSTGETLRNNGYTEVETLLESTACLCWK